MRGWGQKIAAERRAKFGEQEGATACGLCDWRHEGKLGEGARLFAAHRSEHSEPIVHVSRRPAPARDQEREREERSLLDLLANRGELTALEAAEALGEKIGTVKNVLRRLHRGGAVEVRQLRAGERAPSLYRVAGTEPTREQPEEAVSNADRNALPVLELLRERGAFKSPEIGGLLGRSAGSVASSLLYLERHGLAERVGDRRNRLFRATKTAK